MQWPNCNKFSQPESVTITEAIFSEYVEMLYRFIRQSVLSLVEREKLRRIVDVNYSLFS